MCAALTWQGQRTCWPHASWGPLHMQIGVLVTCKLSCCSHGGWGPDHMRLGVRARHELHACHVWHSNHACHEPLLPGWAQCWTARSTCDAHWGGVLHPHHAPAPAMVVHCLAWHCRKHKLRKNAHKYPVDKVRWVVDTEHGLGLCDLHCACRSTITYVHRLLFYLVFLLRYHCNVLGPSSRSHSYFSHVTAHVSILLPPAQSASTSPTANDC